MDEWLGFAIISTEVLVVFLVYYWYESRRNRK